MSDLDPRHDFAAALAAAVDPQAVLDALARLEQALSTRIVRAVERTTAEAIDALRALGHELEPLPEVGPLAFRAPAGHGRTLVLEVLSSVGVSSRVLDEAEYAALVAPPQPSPEEARFYAMLNDVRERERTLGWKKLSATERRVLVLGEFEAEVMNGGFSQFFLNSAGDHAAEVLAALRRIGARRAAQVLEEAMSLFPDATPPVDRDERGRVLASLGPSADASLERLTARFYVRCEPIAALVGAKLPS